MKWFAFGNGFQLGCCLLVIEKEKGRLSEIDRKL
jgi:hypothetical protein